MNNLTLSNGITIPAIGFGTWKTTGSDTQSSMQAAFDAGYRLIDSAAAYQNEDSVGKAIKESGLPREQIFVTTKLWVTERGYKKAMAAFDKSLHALGLEYLDLYLIHWPASAHEHDDWKGINTDTWRALEELYEQGKIKSIGVSNFLVHHLEALMDKAKVAPMVNQIEYHPGYTQRETTDWCQQHDIIPEAWAPLGAGRLLSDPVLESMAKKYGKSTAQICLRFCVQTGVIAIPKSTKPERIQENIEVFDFTLDDDDLQRLENLESSGFSGLHPDQVKF